MGHAGPDAARGSAIVRWALTAWLIVLAGCSSSANSPCFGIAVGDHLSLEFVDTYDVNSMMQWSGPESSTATCGFGFDVERGQTLDATIADSWSGEDAGCRVAAPVFNAFSGWTWTKQSNGAASPFGGVLLQGNYSASRGTCSGSMALVAKVANGADPFAPSVPGSIPNVVLSRVFTGPGTADCETCFGYFVVNVRRQ